RAKPAASAPCRRSPTRWSMRCRYSASNTSKCRQRRKCCGAPSMRRGARVRNPPQKVSDTLPLAGIRVLEFCHTIMGPTAGLLLADLGADVIKIEPVKGDSTRRLVGFAAGFFGTFNRNKRSVAIDLKADEGRALLHRLAAT